MTQANVKTPTHLWVIGVLALLWNAMGAFDYTATQLRLEFYMGGFTPEQLDYFYNFPSWVEGAWAVGVWFALLGTIGLLLRKSWAMALYGISILGLLVTSVHNFVLSNGAEIMGEAGVNFAIVIWVVAVFLLLYARAMRDRKVLR